MTDARFDGQVVLVTGGSRGIGRAICLAFAQRGARVAVHYRADAEAAQTTLNLLPGDGHAAFQADAADPDAVVALIDAVVAQMGGLNVLVNNAGIYEEHPPAVVDFDTWRNHWERTIRVNLMGAAHASYGAARHMMAHGGGRIVNVSSRGAFRGEPTAPAYGASKAGMNAMGQSLAVALAPHGIFVGTVAPGFVETDMAAEILAGERGGGIRAQSPLGRVATPEEVAHAVVFLAEPQTAFMTGCILDVNGASYLRS